MKHHIWSNIETAFMTITAGMVITTKSREDDNKTYHWIVFPRKDSLALVNCDREKDIVSAEDWLIAYEDEILMVQEPGVGPNLCSGKIIYKK